MLRLIGMLTGSVLAIATLVLVLGVPRFSAPDPVPDPVPETEPAPAPAPGPAVEVPATVEQPAAAEIDIPEAVPEPGPEPEPDVAAPRPEPANEPKWYAFWSPFRSELAANGFVAELQESTGIDYRVVKVKTGVYEVAFAYSDDADVEAKLQRIADATGLDMSGS